MSKSWYNPRLRSNMSTEISCPQMCLRATPRTITNVHSHKFRDFVIQISSDLRERLWLVDSWCIGCCDWRRGGIWARRVSASKGEWEAGRIMDSGWSAVPRIISLNGLMLLCGMEYMSSTHSVNGYSGWMRFTFRNLCDAEFRLRKQKDTFAFFIISQPTYLLQTLTGGRQGPVYSA